MKNHLKDYLVLFIIAGLIVFFDQWTKSLVRANLGFRDYWSPFEWLTPYARIVHWKNTGAAFGMFQSFGGVFTILAIIVSIVILYYYPQVPRNDWPLRLAMGMQLGGALGNLIDRLTQGGTVTDFISIGNFAVFNIADASISVGVVVLLIGMWIKERQGPSSPVETTAAEKDQGDEGASPPLPEEIKSE